MFRVKSVQRPCILAWNKCIYQVKFWSFVVSTDLDGVPWWVFFFKFCLKLGTFCFHSQTTTTCSEAILIQPSCLVLSCIVIADYLRGLVGNGWYQIPETNFQVSIFSQGTRTFNIADKNFLSKTLVHNSLCLIVNNHYLQSYNPNFFIDSKTSHR